MPPAHMVLFRTLSRRPGADGSRTAALPHGQVARQLSVPNNLRNDRFGHLFFACRRRCDLYQSRKSEKVSVTHPEMV